MNKHLKKVSLLLFLGGFSTGIINATSNVGFSDATQQQQNSCVGIVKDSKGEAIIGASVVVKNTSNGTITDFDGKFSLNNVKKGRGFTGISLVIKVRKLYGMELH